MRRGVCDNLLFFLAVNAMAVASSPLLAQSVTPAVPVKHYGYSGQDKMLECMQRVFGKHAAAFPSTVRYGELPFNRSRPPQIVKGHWEPVTEHITFPPTADLPCPATREGIAKLLDTDVTKLLFVPEGGTAGRYSNL
jgi:hypothetical protein